MKQFEMDALALGVDDLEALDAPWGWKAFAGFTVGFGAGVAIGVGIAVT